METINSEITTASAVRIFFSWYCRAGQLFFYDREKCPKVFLGLVDQKEYDVEVGKGWFFDGGPVNLIDPFGPYDSIAEAMNDAALLYKGVKTRLFT